MSRKPPRPAGMKVAESLTPTQRLSFDSIRSPSVPTSAATTPNARAFGTPKCVTGRNAHEMRHEPKTEPKSPSQLLFGETVGHSLCVRPRSFCAPTPNAKPPMSEIFTMAIT